MCATTGPGVERHEQAEGGGGDHVLVFAVLESGVVQVYGVIDNNLVPLVPEVSYDQAAVS